MPKPTQPSRVLRRSQSFGAGMWLCLASLSGIPAEAADDAAEVFRRVAPSVCTVYAERAGSKSLGSGFRISADGEFVTNYHVIDGARSATVDCDGRSSAVVSIVAYSADLDLAILKTGSVGPFLRLSKSPPPEPGSAIFAFGSPLGLPRSISTGLSSGVRDVAGRSLLQISAPISAGNSGGPIVDASGEVVGVAVGTLSRGQNLNFAVPVAAVRGLRPEAPKIADPPTERPLSAPVAPPVQPSAGSSGGTDRLLFRGSAFGQSCAVAVDRERRSKLPLVFAHGPSRVLRDDTTLNLPVPSVERPASYRAISDFEAMMRRNPAFRAVVNAYLPDYLTRLKVSMFDAPLRFSPRATDLPTVEGVSLSIGAAVIDTLFDAPVLAAYECDDAGALISGRYVFLREVWDGYTPTSLNPQVLARVTAFLSEKYGVSSSPQRTEAACVSDGLPEKGPCFVQEIRWRGSQDEQIALRTRDSRSELIYFSAYGLAGLEFDAWMRATDPRRQQL